MLSFLQLGFFKRKYEQLMKDEGEADEGESEALKQNAAP